MGCRISDGLSRCAPAIAAHHLRHGARDAAVRGRRHLVAGPLRGHRGDEARPRGAGHRAGVGVRRTQHSRAASREHGPQQPYEPATARRGPHATEELHHQPQARRHRIPVRNILRQPRGRDTDRHHPFQDRHGIARSRHSRLRQEEWHRVRGRTGHEPAGQLRDSSRPQAGQFGRTGGTVVPARSGWDAAGRRLDRHPIVAAADQPAR